MIFLAFLFEVSDKIPTIAQMYFGGLFWAIVVFFATYINRWFGLVALVISFIFSTLSISDSLGADILNDVVLELGNDYVKHWNYSTFFSVILVSLAFISGLLLKKYYRNRKLNLI